MIMIILCISCVLVIWIGVAIAFTRLYKKYVSLIKSTKKNNYYFGLLKIWMSKRNQGKSIGNYLRSIGIEKTAVYGFGDIGKLLCEEIALDKIEIECVIDRNRIESHYRFYTIEDTIPNPQAVIVTPYLEYDQISEMLKGIFDCEIISLEDIIYDY